MAQSLIGTPLEALESQLPNAPLSQVADVIRCNWKPMSPYARPYAQAMLQLPSIQSNYYADSGKAIVLYFLANAQTWRGPIAKLVKKELNRRLKEASK